MPNIKLTYFNSRGIGDIIRILLKCDNIDFEDVRIQYDDWPALKPSTPFGQLPVYEENDKAVCQSLAIARYLAKKVKLTGDNDWENLEIDALADTITDLKSKIVVLFYETDEEKKEKIRQNLLSETVPYYLERFDKIVTENGGHLVGNKLTWVDIYLASISELVQAFLCQKNIFENYENLSKLRSLVWEIPAIKSFIANRPQTQY